MRSLLFVLAVCCPSLASAQIYTPVFPALSGQILLDSVVARYKPGVVLDYANARDTLYSRVLAKKDSLSCIYSGHTLYLDPAQDPTQYIYQNGGPLGMNTEHAYPQAKGAADGNPRSDMHHLFPARIPVNEARGDKPYADIPDAQTKEWFLKAQVYTSIPAQNKDLYSESNNTLFEPRESVKGDLARAIFYFYTMYKAEADAADPAFFSQQRATLCQWHDQDDADSTELIKTRRIAPYQEDKPNPYILDCTLARRTFCPELAPGCATNAAAEPAGQSPLGLQMLPNPFGQSGQIVLTLPFRGDVQFRLLSPEGVELGSWQAPDVQAGTFSLKVELQPRALPQFGILEAKLSGAGRITRQVISVILSE